MHVRHGLLEAIGQTPLIRLEGPSRATGCAILGKAEFLNPGGSIKDRAALAMIRAAQAADRLPPGTPLIEGTAGNTGIGLALLGNALGHPVRIVMPETQSREKQDMLRLCGAELHLVKAVPYRDPGNYVHVARRLAEEEGGLWINQFDNTANRDGHRDTTGAEILQQTGGRLDAFTCAVGTGGTLAGVGMALKAHDPDIQVILADPLGSALFAWHTTGELKSEGASITEGIGQGRVTVNLEGAPLDGALRIPDPEALKVLFDLIRQDGLVLGGSSGINVAAAIRVARDLGPGHTVVTVLCDGGARYQSKLYNPDFLRARDLPLPDWL